MTSTLETKVPATADELQESVNGMSDCLSLRTHVAGPSTAASSRERIQTLEVVRAVAAWMVVYHHYMQIVHDSFSQSNLGWLFSRKGGVGVDIFFVLSGFVMHRVISSRKTTAADFLKRRALRIIPAYWFYTLCTVFCLWFLPGAIPYTDWNLRNLLASMAFIPHTNLSGTGKYPVLTVGWTLTFEMFFYSMLAALILVAPRRVTPLAVLLLCTLPNTWPSSWPWGSVAGNWRLGEFASGIAIGVAFLKVPQLFCRSSVAGGSLFIITGVSTILGISGASAKTIGASLIIIGALCIESHRGVRSCIPRILLLLGEVSYSTYLSHVLIISLLLAAFGHPSGQITDASLCITVTVAVLLVSIASHRTIEQIPRTIEHSIIKRHSVPKVR